MLGIGTQRSAISVHWAAGAGIPSGDSLARAAIWRASELMRCKGCAARIVVAKTLRVNFCETHGNIRKRLGDGSRNTLLVGGQPITRGTISSAVRFGSHHPRRDNWAPEHEGKYVRCRNYRVNYTRYNVKIDLSRLYRGQISAKHNDDIPEYRVRRLKVPSQFGYTSFAAKISTK